MLLIPYIDNDLLTYSMEQSRSSEANQSLQLVKKFPAFLWNPKVPHRTFVVIYQRVHNFLFTQVCYVKHCFM
jgi:hypothetical protein